MTLRPTSAATLCLVATVDPILGQPLVVAVPGGFVRVPPLLSPKGRTGKTSDP
jgi:hypothetical protein